MIAILPLLTYVLAWFLTIFGNAKDYQASNNDSVI